MKQGTPFIISLALLAIAGCREAPKPKPKAVPVFVKPVIEEEIAQTGQLIGQVKADKSVNLVARVKGFLTKKNFEEGQMVKKGRLLFKIEPDEFQAKVKSAQAELLKSQALQKNAIIEYNRQKTLLAKNATSERTYDNAVSSKMQADAAVMNSQAELALAKLNLSYTSIPAPFNGRVGLVNYDVGNVVGPGSGTLANIVRMDLVRVMFNISEVDLLRVFARKSELQRSKDDVIVRVRFQNGKTYSITGQISYWSNQINISTGTLLMEATFENPKGELIPGMYVHVLFESRKKFKSLLVPRTAIIKEQNGKFVLKVTKQNLVEKVKIELGQEHGAYQQVMSGLEKGDMVVTGGLQKVRPGIKVVPKVDTAVEEAGSLSKTEPVKNTGSADDKSGGDVKKATGSR